MARRMSSHVLLVLTLVALLLTLSSPPLQARQASRAGQAVPPIRSSLDFSVALEQKGKIRINEVMPKPEAGGFEWVELYNPRTFYVYLPLVLRNAGSSSLSQQPSTVSATLVGSPDISGWQITDEDGNSYTIPDALPAVPLDAYILILFDGLGSAADDYDFGDGLAVLHSPPGMADIFEDDADQVGLYSSSTHTPDTIAGFVAWSAPPGEDGSNASAAGLWQENWYVNLHMGFGVEPEGGETAAGISLGLRPGRPNESRGGWAAYLADDLSPGAANPVPCAYISTVADGQQMAADGFALGWSWVADATYQLQIDDDPAFGSTLVDIVLDAPWYAPDDLLPEGDYWWRVRAIGHDGQPSEWRAPAAIGVSGIEEGTAVSGEAQGATAEVTVPNIQWLRQRKDTHLLCVDGCNEVESDPKKLTGTWDSPHPDGIYEHGWLNCVRASIAMIVTRYTKDLSQDRIAYQENMGGDPWLDLGHLKGTHGCGTDGETDGGKTRELLAWALDVDEEDILYVKGSKPSFDDITGWIDAGRPVLRVDQWPAGGHATVIAGYRERYLGLKKEVWLLDPWSGDTWPDYEDDDFEVDCYYVAPASAPNARADEPSIWADSDSDGIKDWDEETRWKESYNNLDPAKADTDADGVPDKQDMREYLFDDTGQYWPSGFGILLRVDADNDGLYKEIDPDSDNGGSPDGCEDTNRNGRYEPWLGETSNFDPAQERQCPYYVQSMGGRSNCVRTWAHGYVLTESGMPEVGVQMRVGNDQGWQGDAWTNANGYYEATLAWQPTAGKWYIQVFKDSRVSSEQFWWQTTASCAEPYSLQEVEVVWRHR